MFDRCLTDDETDVFLCKLVLIMIYGIKSISYIEKRPDVKLWRQRFATHQEISWI